MKKLHFLLCCLLLTAILSCKKELGDPDGPQPPDPRSTDSTGTTKMPTKSVQVKLPSNAGVELTGCTVMTHGNPVVVDGSGQSKVAFNSGKPVIAYVFDKTDRLLLAGFITDSTQTIDAASTAKVLMYFAYAMPWKPYELTPLFINRYGDVPAFSEWTNEFTTLMQSKPLALSDGSFAPALKSRMDAIYKRDALNIRQGIKGKKASDISVDVADIRSGLQVAEEGLSNFSITNTYRRRAHAFIYKKSFKATNGKETVLLPTIENNTQATMDMAVDPVGGIGSITGVLSAWWQESTMDLTAVKSGPAELLLEDNESEATYLLRVVGPGAAQTQKPITNAEISKQTRLEIETMVIDFLLPAIMDIVGNADALNKQAFNISKDAPIVQFIDKAEVFIKSTPDVYEEMKKGDYGAALRKGIAALYTNARQKEFEELVFTVAALQYHILKGSDTPYEEFIKDGKNMQNKIGKFAAIMKVIDLGLQGSDYLRIAHNILSSAQLDEWKIRARSSQVTLTPQESIAIVGTKSKISAIIKNLNLPKDVHPFFEWSTAGKWGKISDTKGHNNQLSFASADSAVSYLSNARAADLGDGANLDYIYVTAYVGSTKIGTDTAVVNIKKDKYEIRPSGVTISGKKGSQNSVVLYLEKPDGANAITNGSDGDYKVIWTTPGKHGKLSGQHARNVTTLTNINNNQATYDCFDDKTRDGVETISVRIYRKGIGAPDAEYALFDEVKGTVKINNDPKKKILHIPTTLFHGDTSSGPHRSWPSGKTYFSYVCAKATGALVPEDKDAQSYFARFYGQKRPTIGAYTTHSWTPERLTYTAPASYAVKKYADGNFALLYSYSAYNGHTEKHVETNGNPGMVEVIITLK